MINYDEKGITSRVMMAAKLLGLNDTELAATIGVRKQLINQVKNEGLAMPAKRAIIFLGAHREIDASWLLFGEGDMMLKPNIDGRHKFVIKGNGDMAITSDNTEGINYKEKYEGLKDILKEKERYIKVVEKSLDNQNRVLDKLIDKLG